MTQSFYAQLLNESFESLKSASDPGSRASGGAVVEIVTPNDPVLGKVVPVPEDVRSALVDAGYKVKGDDKVDDKGKDNSEDGIKSNPDDTSLEASSHNPDSMIAAAATGKVPAEMNLIVNGVHIADSVNENAHLHTPVVSIMTPNDVLNPDASIHYLTGDETGEVKAYLSTEGYKVASTPQELIALLKR